MDEIRYDPSFSCSGDRMNETQTQTQAHICARTHAYTYVLYVCISYYMILKHPTGGVKSDVVLRLSQDWDR